MSETQEPSKVPMSTPASTRVRSGSCRRSDALTRYTAATATSPTTKARIWMATTLHDR
jgi:hypothetical protein